MGFRVGVSGFRVQGSGFRFQGPGFAFGGSELKQISGAVALAFSREKSSPQGPPEAFRRLGEIHFCGLPPLKRPSFWACPLYDSYPGLEVGSSERSEGPNKVRTWPVVTRTFVTFRRSVRRSVLSERPLRARRGQHVTASSLRRGARAHQLETDPTYKVYGSVHLCVICAGVTV